MTNEAKLSEVGFDVASTWLDHRFNCAIYGDSELPETSCTCRVRELASHITSAIADAVRKERERCLDIGNRAWEQYGGSPRFVDVFESAIHTTPDSKEQPR